MWLAIASIFHRKIICIAQMDIIRDIREKIFLFRTLSKSNIGALRTHLPLPEIGASSPQTFDQYGISVNWWSKYVISCKAMGYQTSTRMLTGLVCVSRWRDGNKHALL